ncbi:MAG: hypothetical protein Q7T76_00085 [Ferruginibacter sp.]|nr:hypothetical protein [Ferruginibacter sp.]
MKYIIIAFAMLSIGFNAAAQNETGGTTTAPKMKSKTSMHDCVMMKDNKMMLQVDGKMMEMDKDLAMKNGTMVMMDGSVKMKDGAELMLKNGEMMDMNGKVSMMKMPKMKGKMKRKM